MMMLTLPDFKERVMISNEIVKFSQVDPYGHLNASRYLEFMTNHRVEALVTQLECHTMDILKETGMGFVVTDARLKFRDAAICGEVLEVASWVVHHDSRSFNVKFVIASAESRRIKATGDFTFFSINVQTGKPGTIPAGLPSRSSENLLLKRPLAPDYVRTLKVPPGVDL